MLKLSALWNSINVRRLELIDKKHDLSDLEKVEFKILQEGFFTYLNALHPRNTISDLELDKLKERLSKIEKGTTD